GAREWAGRSVPRRASSFQPPGFVGTGLRRALHGEGVVERLAPPPLFLGPALVLLGVVGEGVGQKVAGFGNFAVPSGENFNDGFNDEGVTRFRRWHVSLLCSKPGRALPGDNPAPVSARHGRD